MNIIPEPLEFQWDKGNIDKSLKKHGIENEEAESVFFDENSVFSEDIKHSRTEKRYQILGRSERNILLNVIFTLRGNKIRVISARKVNNKERRLYEQKKGS